MKTKASSFLKLKQMVSALVAAVKAKSTAVRVKTSALKTRLLIFGILRNKDLLKAAINTKIHAILGQHQEQDKQDPQAAGDGDDDKKAIVIYAPPSYNFSAELGTHDVEAQEEQEEEEGEEDSDEYLSHCLFAEEEEDDELVSAPGSVIDVMRGAREREAGEGAEFSLEDEIDHVADVFIKRIHRQLKLQKLDSFKRLCEMLERGA